MGILDNILNLFNPPSKDYKDILDTKKAVGSKFPQLKDIGVITANCPYCNIKLKKFPARKTKCKNCGEYFYVRRRPSDYKKVLIKENEKQLIEDEWEKRRYINEKTKVQTVYNNEIIGDIVIDASSEMNAIFNDLIKNYKDYCNYDEILRINEKDRLPILQFIWSKWMVHGRSIELDLKYQYEQYDFKDIQIITLKEHKRIMAIYKAESFKNMGIYFVEYYSDAERNYFRMHPKEHKNWIRLCAVDDIPKVMDVWYCEDGHIDKYTFDFKAPPLFCIVEKRKHIIFPPGIDYVEFWRNGKINKMAIEDFYEFCEENNIDMVTS